MKKRNTNNNVIVVIKIIQEGSMSDEDNANDDRRFPSTQLAKALLNGVVARAENYQCITASADGLLVNETPFEVIAFKSIIESAVNQSISTLSSIATHQDIEILKISEGESLTAIFNDLLRQYLPPISSEEYFCIGRILALELINELNFKSYAVDSGQLLCENGDLFVQVNHNYSLPGLLSSDKSVFQVALDV